MLQFKDFDLINESLDTPTLDYVLTDDSKLPSSAYYQFKIEDTIYSIIFSLSNSKGLYKMHAGMLPSGKNMKLWKIKPNHVRKFLSTAILIAFDAIDNHLKNKIFGLAIRLPKEIKKNYIDLMTKLVNAKYKSIMKVLPVSKTEEDDNFNYIFIAKQGQNIQKLFSSKDFSAYNFSNYTIIPNKALENLEDKRFVKKTNLSDRPIYKDFSINSETVELRELAHKIVTNVSPMKKTEVNLNVVENKIVDHEEKINYILQNSNDDFFDSLVSGESLALILLSNYEKYFNFLKKNNGITDKDILNDIQTIVKNYNENSTSFHESKAIQKIITSSGYDQLDHNEKLNRWLRRFNAIYKQTEDEKIKNYLNYYYTPKIDHLVANIKRGLNRVLSYFPKTYDDLSIEDELNLLIDHPSSEYEFFSSNEYYGWNKTIAILLMEQFPRKYWIFSKKLYEMSKKSAFEYHKIIDGKIDSVPEMKEVYDYLLQLVEIMDRTKGKNSKVWSKIEQTWDEWKKSRLEFLDKEKYYKDWVLKRKSIDKPGDINSEEFNKQYFDHVSPYMSEILSGLRQAQYIYNSDIVIKKSIPEKLTEIYDSNSVFETFNCTSMNFDDMYNCKTNTELLNIFKGDVETQQIAILEYEHNNQVNMKAIDRLFSQSQMYNYTEGTGSFNDPLRNFFKRYNKGTLNESDFENTITVTVNAWYSLSKMFDVLKPTTQDLVVFRGTSIPDNEYDWKEDIITDPGFLSTSASFAKASSFKHHGGSLLIIRIPSGSKIIPANGYSDFSSEHEYILPPLSILKTYKVMKYSTEQYVFLDYIGNGMESLIEKVREFFPITDAKMKETDERIKKEFSMYYEKKEGTIKPMHYSYGNFHNDLHFYEKINEILSN